MACDHIDFRQKYTLPLITLVIFITILNITMQGKKNRQFQPYVGNNVGVSNLTSALKY